jgi:uncharacterized protein
MDTDAFFSRRVACRGRCRTFLPASAALLALSLLAVSLGGAGPALSQQPGFDCATDHNPDEVTICGNFALAQLDRQLTDLYAAARVRLDASQQIALRDKQRAWIRQRAACGRDASCITRLYQERIPQLSALIVQLDAPRAAPAPALPPAGSAPAMAPQPRPSPGTGQGTRDACDMFPTLC